MQTVQNGDRVRVHYAVHFPDGSKTSSRGRRPLELTAGAQHPCLPMLGDALSGMALGTTRRLSVAPEQAAGLPDPARLRRVSRDRFPAGARLEPGRWVRLAGPGGRSCRLRVLEVAGPRVLAALPPLRADEAVEVTVKVVGFLRPGAAPRPAPNAEEGK